MGGRGELEERRRIEKWRRKDKQIPMTMQHIRKEKQIETYSEMEAEKDDKKRMRGGKVEKRNTKKEGKMIKKISLADPTQVTAKRPWEEEQVIS